eukprot:m.33940 g.33940  ORF g.33940 m.33940 type:complete len:372 (+) comp12605_c0_seq2:97-1212(+)
MAGTFDESLLRAFAELTIPPAVTAVLEMNALTQLDAFDGLTQDDLVDAGLPKLAAKRVFSTVLPAARGFSGAGGSRQSGAALSDSFSPERSSRSQTKSGGRAHLNNSGRARGTKELIGTNFGDVCTYTGELLDGKADGQGRLVFPNGTVYDGAFQNDRRNGFGTSTFIDDDGTETYAGEWRDGKRHGRATFTFADGDVYEGAFMDNDRTGRGTLYFNSGDNAGDVYVGDFVDSEYHGRGRYTRANGTYYDGGYKHDSKDGKGFETISYNDGSGSGSYEGEYRNDKQHGRGKERYPDGDTYDGSFEFDERCGYGTMSYSGTSPGEEYAGEWKDGEPHGAGTYTYDDGSYDEGVWENGNKIHSHVDSDDSDSD